MTINVQGKNITIDNKLAEKYESISATELTERNIRCHIAISYEGKSVDEILRNVDAEELSKTLTSAIRYEISIFER